MITIENLIEDLKKKDQQEVVECIIVSSDGTIICAYVKSLAKQITKFLKMFN